MKKKMESTNTTQRASVSGAGKSSKSEGEKGKFPMEIIFLVMVILVIAVVFFFRNGGEKSVNEEKALGLGNETAMEQLTEYSVEQLVLETYESKNSRDENKRLTSAFTEGMPIQVKLLYKIAGEERPIINFNIYKKDTYQNRTNGLYGEGIKVQLSGEGERYVTVPNKDATPGEYTVEVWVESNEEGMPAMDTGLKQEFAINPNGPGEAVEEVSGEEK